MTRTLTALILALSLTVTSLAATPAQAGSKDDFGKLVAGAITLFIISNAVKSKSKSQPAQTAQTYWYQGDRNPRWALPSECYFRLNTKKHKRSRGVYGKVCLRELTRFAHRLPNQCEQIIRVRYGRRATVYGADCLHQLGYRVEGRRR